MMWIFGYGSLMWRPDFDYQAKCAATLAQFRRELWQGSPDHRGTPEQPGRVVTLVADDTATCAGMAFAIAAQHRNDILRALDHREQGGYERAWVKVTLDDGRQVDALTYIGWPGNAHYLGAASQADIARQIRSSVGPSGRNIDYVTELAREMRRLGQGSDPVAVFCAQFEEVR